MSKKKPPECIFEDCHEPVSPRSKSGMCEYHLSRSEWMADQFKHDAQAATYIEIDKATGMWWIHQE